ncbi:hypothetical protein [Lysobacter sp. F6437]|uniref:hypothetical protein n=1 Tax=Lysobacter sp. F6437 TaxID=3459296 RepID=UPI00403D6FEC
MDVERQGQGHWAFRLGPIEKWIATIIGAAVVAFGYWFVSEVRDQGDAIDNLATQQAVMNNQLVTLNLQLADVPSISRKMAEHDVRIDRLESDVKELRGTRGLK